MSREEIEKLLEEKLERLRNLPKLIEEVDRDRQNFHDISRHEETLKNKMLDLEAQAGVEVDDDGKKVYTNKEARAARAVELAAGDQNIKMVKGELQKRKDEKAALDANSFGLRNEFSALKVEMNVLTEILRGRNSLLMTSLTLRIKPEIVTEVR